MDTLSSIGKAVWGTKTDEEPVSGETGAGTASDPYDAGNAPEQKALDTETSTSTGPGTSIGPSTSTDPSASTTSDTTNAAATTQKDQASLAAESDATPAVAQSKKEEDPESAIPATKPGTSATPIRATDFATVTETGKEQPSEEKLDRVADLRIQDEGYDGKDTSGADAHTTVHSDNVPATKSTGDNISANTETVPDSSTTPSSRTEPVDVPTSSSKTGGTAALDEEGDEEASPGRSQRIRDYVGGGKAAAKPVGMYDDDEETKKDTAATSTTSTSTPAEKTTSAESADGKGGKLDRLKQKLHIKKH